MKRPHTAAVLLFAVCASGQAQGQYQPSWESLDKRPAPSWFQDAKFGIFIHWGVYSVPAYAPVGKYAEWYWNALSKGPTETGKPNPTYQFHSRVYGKDFPYFDFAPMFRAEMFDPAHWADVFKRSGARYVVLTSKHHDGFALWPSEHASRAWNRPWNSTVAGPKRDLLGDLSDQVRKAGLRMGFYYSLYEWYNPLWLADRKKYAVEHMHPQFKDVVTRYKPAIIFSDGEWDMPSTDWKTPELLAWLYNESPVRDEVVVNDRWGKESRHKHGTYWTTEYTAGLQDGSHPWEENRGMGHSYGFNRAEKLSDYRTERELILMLGDLVSRGGNLLLDIGPTADGRIPVIQEERLLQIGRWLDTNGEAIYGSKPWVRTRQWTEGEQPKLETGQHMTRYEVTDYVDRKKPGQAVIEAFFTTKGDDVYAIVPGWPGDRFALRNVAAGSGLQVELLGRPGPLKWSKTGDGVAVHMPAASGDAASAQYAYVLRFRGLKSR
ncbi:MAG TPA: alpha-L-fucosidase [Bryobacteraceae bacterium]|nr:alpha-L-fucosidase [Bryobacteraceae bacterium]